MLFQHHIVIELASVLAGPSVGMFFAELGATVIKVENRTTQGDVTRKWRLKQEDREGISAYFASVNWGKKSIALDLRKKEDQDLVHHFVKQADFVLSSYIPGAAAKLRMDSDTLLSLNPRLICGEINGYGETDSRAAFDAIIQAEAGFTYMNGLGKDIYKMPVALMDVLAAHQLKEAMLLAYIERLQTGKGKRVSVSLIEAGMASLINQATNWLMARHIPQAIGSAHPNIVPYGTIFYTQDHLPIVLAVGTDAQFQQLCSCLDLDTPEEFATNPQRVQAHESVNALLARAILGVKRGAFLEALHAAGVPAGAVNNMADVMDLPAARHNLLIDGNTKGMRSMIAQGILTVSTLATPPDYDQDREAIISLLGKPVF